MQPLIRRELDGAVAFVAHSTRADGDLSPSTVSTGELAIRRQAVVTHPWCSVRQVHSDRVVSIDGATDLALRPVADALVTQRSRVALAVHAGDCVPVGLVSAAGAVAAAHAGWKGLEAGVLESTVRRLRAIDPSAPIVAAVGPHIHQECYAFGASDLDRLGQRLDAAVVGETDDGSPALDLTTAIRVELARLDVAIEAMSDDCTACDGDRYWSHRARQEPGRIALVAWLE